VMAFSSRRKEVLEARRGPGLEAGKIAALATRAPKQPIEDRAVLREQWQAAARTVDLDLTRLVDTAKTRASERTAADAKGPGLAERGLALLKDFAERIKGTERDPLVPDHVLKRGPQEIAAAQAVASAVRHLSQREAGFVREDLYKAALDFGLPTTIGHVEKAVRSLVRSGQLLRGKGEHKGWLASREEVEREARILAWANEGKGAVEPILTERRAEASVQASALVNQGFKLNEGQLGAARLILTSRDRTLAVQGVAGAGKSSVLKPVADVLREEGRKVLGLSVQNTLVQMLERDTGIEAQTLASFLKRWGAISEGEDRSGLVREANKELGGSVLILDEASMVSNADKEQLIRIANRVGAQRLVLMGDRKQLGAVDAGKPFDVMQQAGIETAVMGTNLRARTEVLRNAQQAAQEGRIEDAMRHLAPQVIEVGNGAAVEAAAAWLSLPSGEREATAIYASGRALRSAVNEAVQTGLKANGELGPGAMRLSTLSRVNVTREELRYASTYAPGMVVEVARRQRGQGVSPGEYRVVSADIARERVTLENERGRQFELRPGKFRPQGEQDALR
ncbi:MAG: AAA family ATPase, partial [Novosphingobium sp.]|nr:AAA family ATPase [Novosphingobium sp.]